MNIIEMEDMVKGLPDDALFQYAQFPDPQIPQFLALSEVQRRQDMRQRFEAAQQGAQPSVKDQILQGGIAGLQSPPPMAPEMMPPMGQEMMPPQMGPEMMPPVGMYTGGLTSVPAYPGQTFLTPEEIELRRRHGQLWRASVFGGRETREPARQERQRIEERLDSFVPTPEAQLVSADRPLVLAPGNVAETTEGATSLEDEVRPTLDQFHRSPAQTASEPRFTAGVRRQQSRYPAQLEEVLGQLEGFEPSPEPPLMNELTRRTMGAMGGVDTPQEFTDYMESLRAAREAGLPDPVDISEFVARADERVASIREQAKRDALGAALLQLGAGIAGGDLVGGLRAAGEQAIGIMREGRLESAEAERAAEQMRLQDLQAQRQSQIEQQQFRLGLDRDLATAGLEMQSQDLERQGYELGLLRDLVGLQQSLGESRSNALMKSISLQANILSALLSGETQTRVTDAVTLREQQRAFGEAVSRATDSLRSGVMNEDEAGQALRREIAGLAVSFNLDPRGVIADFEREGVIPRLER